MCAYATQLGCICSEYHEAFKVLQILSEHWHVCVCNNTIGAHLSAQMLGLECRVALPNGVSALSVAASPELMLSGWSDGFIHCHSRLPAGVNSDFGSLLAATA
jgi:hypothetical protein